MARVTDSDPEIVRARRQTAELVRQTSTLVDNLTSHHLRMSGFLDRQAQGEAPEVMRGARRPGQG